MKSEGEKTITKNYSNRLCSGIEYWRVNVKGLGSPFNNLFEILRNGMEKDEMNVSYLALVFDLKIKSG
jgi:hypothetical protein